MYSVHSYLPPFPPLIRPHPLSIILRTLPTIIHDDGSLRQGRREFAPCPDAGAVFPEDDGYGHEDEGDEAEERAGPVDAERFEHVHAEEREDGAGEGAEEGVCCDG